VLPSLLKIQDATVVQDGRRVLDQISLEIQEGEHTAILGPNGSGKSSLIKLITHHYYPLAHPDDEPAVMVFGRKNWNVFELRSLLGIVTADLHYAFVSGSSAGPLRALDAVISGFFATQGLFSYQNITETMQERGRQALALVDASHLTNKWIAELSTGEVRRILIARALVAEPRALMLDEPTTGLDLVSRNRFLHTLQQIARQGKTIILVTHHIEEIFPEIARVILLRQGRIEAEGPKQEILTAERLTAVFGAPIHVQELAGYYTATSYVAGDPLKSEDTARSV
jgi:iron complex transport system ATP-binding protein